MLHHKVFDGDRFVAEVDLAFPRLKIAIELDGSHHLEAEVRERDLPRQNDLVLLGWTVLRFSWKRFREPTGPRDRRDPRRRSGRRADDDPTAACVSRTY